MFFLFIFCFCMFTVYKTDNVEEGHMVSGCQLPVAGLPLLPGCRCCRVAVVAGLPLLPGCRCCRVAVVAGLPLLPGCRCCRVAVVAGLPLLPGCRCCRLRVKRCGGSVKLCVCAESGFKGL